VRGGGCQGRRVRFIIYTHFKGGLDRGFGGGAGIGMSQISQHIRSLIQSASNDLLFRPLLQTLGHGSKSLL